tara:strand:- start:210 stop:410 length:201 start_codon:yes stop_codon:yes gene_type:complete
MDELQFVIIDIKNTLLDTERRAYGRETRSIRISKRALRQWHGALVLAEKKLVDMERSPNVADIAEA